MYFLKNAFLCIKIKIKLINHYCLPILSLLHIMPYIMLAYLMLFVALSNAACLYIASLLQMLFVFMLCLGLLTNSLFISSIILHHSQCF